MTQKLEKINQFLQEHHVLSLATSYKDELSACSLFYAYSSNEVSFVIASSQDTTHIEHILKNNKVAGNILLETLTVGKIQGVQFKGTLEPLVDTHEYLKKLYFKKFPYALALNPTLWIIKVSHFKMTDNRLGFGKKIVVDLSLDT